MNLTRHGAERIARRMVVDGFTCSPDNVWEVYETGTLDGNEALASCILGELDDSPWVAFRLRTRGSMSKQPQEASSAATVYP